MGALKPIIEKNPKGYKIIYGPYTSILRIDAVEFGLPFNAVIVRDGKKIAYLDGGLVIETSRHSKTEEKLVAKIEKHHPFYEGITKQTGLKGAALLLQSIEEVFRRNGVHETYAKTHRTFAKLYQQMGYNIVSTPREIQPATHLKSYQVSDVELRKNIQIKGWVLPSVIKIRKPQLVRRRKIRQANSQKRKKRL